MTVQMGIVVFYSSARPDRPADRIWLDTLREYGRPVAVLARPEPGWRRRVGQRSVDGFLQRIGLGYCEEGAMLVHGRGRRSNGRKNNGYR
ncbi:hypothetical protein ABZX95_40095 [Streptomyces sp. NPDC004232]|uniref:hypothetical protein n=1 Tax=Streptomyces sp. NPDC004232 TaxID=3154454 RepID=UPI0033A5190E